jgi:pimeloyl-ACP methyl ester carboxylesterase
MRVFCFCLLCFVFVGCVEYVTEDGLFSPSHATISTRDSIGIGQTKKTNLELEAAPNIMLRGYRISQPNTRRSILYFGGNTSILSGIRTELDSLSLQYNADVFAFDWRGYGFSDGNPSLRAIMDDALKVFDFVYDSTESSPIIIGRSLGSGVATYVAAHRKPAALILISPLSNLNKVIQGWSIFHPWYERPFISIAPDDSLRNLHPQPIDIASQITCPVLILHGDQDKLIPISSGRELFDSLRNSASKKFVTLSGKDHYNIDITSGVEADSIGTFINSVYKH